MGVAYPRRSRQRTVGGKRGPRESRDHTPAAPGRIDPSQPRQAQDEPGGYPGPKPFPGGGGSPVSPNPGGSKMRKRDPRRSGGGY